MKSTIFLFLMLILGCFTVTAQSIQEDPSIYNAMHLYKEAQSDKSDCQGWRIQVVATTNRRKMESVKWAFKKKMPYYNAFWTYKEPYYYVKAGAFVTKLEALHALEDIKRKFSGAYIVKDKIKCSTLF